MIIAHLISNPQFNIDKNIDKVYFDFDYFPWL